MPYIPHSEEDISKILASAGAASVDEMLDGVPADLRLKDPLDLPPGLSEQELTRVMKGLCRKNSTVDSGCSSFLGAGAYNHYIPSVVAHMAGRAEFYTAYTPYQPEISQGTLQAIFEYQTLVCQLTGMDVSNASLYDGASAAAEAVLMARRITGKERVLLSAALHPEYGETVKTYLRGAGDRVGTVLYCAEKGTTLPEAVEAAMTDDTACLVVQHPNFFGCLEEARALADIVHGKKALLITVSSEAVSFGLLKPPGELGADIAAGDNQSFGNQLNFGGPYLGFMATKTEFIRQMPGRLVGQTVDRKGKRAFCLTFATREQHIRRERATSNICTNNGLSALQAAIHMTSLGRMGLKTLAHLNLSKAAYLRERLLGVKGVTPGFTSPVFNEFTIRLDNIDADEALKRLLKKGIIGGLGLGRFYPELKRHLLIAATEMNTRPEMDRFAEELSKI
ncbi:MAG: aminomethyl-transferring glycine dehydrogenase subunit GcvPA [Deltaproteobacteria bacterium]|nr:aminomethyl-transferring glycine dehydrogenase subunit GcvPA [Deltaproteobacteria bacterium]